MACAFAVLAGVPAAGKRPAVPGGQLEFRLPDLAGQLVSSADPRFAGMVVLVDLWATWCPPCLSEIPTFVELQREFKDRGLVVVAIAFETGEERQRRTRLREFVTRQGINYLVLDGGPPEDLGAALPALQNVSGFPVEILVDRTGRVAFARNGYGFKKKWADRLRREIESLLGSPGEATEGRGE